MYQDIYEEYMKGDTTKMLLLDQNDYDITRMESRLKTLECQTRANFNPNLHMYQMCKNLNDVGSYQQTPRISLS